MNERGGVGDVDIRSVDVFGVDTEEVEDGREDGEEQDEEHVGGGG